MKRKRKDYFWLLMALAAMALAVLALAIIFQIALIFAGE